MGKQLNHHKMQKWGLQHQKNRMQKWQVQRKKRGIRCSNGPQDKERKQKQQLGSSSSTITKCRNGVCSTKKTECKNGKCKGKREALDAPMAHKTKRGSKSSSWSSSSSTITKKTECKNGKCKGKREA